MRAAALVLAALLAHAALWAAEADVPMAQEPAARAVWLVAITRSLFYVCVEDEEGLRCQPFAPVGPAAACRNTPTVLDCRPSRPDSPELPLRPSRAPEMGA